MCGWNAEQRKLQEYQLHIRYIYAHISHRAVSEVAMGQIRAKTPCRFRRTSEKYAALCSAHFEKTCFENDMAWSMGFVKRRDLIVGSIPTRDTVIPEGPEVLSERQKRQVSEHFAYFHVLASLINSM